MNRAVYEIYRKILISNESISLVKLAPYVYKFECPERFPLTEITQRKTMYLGLPEEIMRWIKE